MGTINFKSSRTELYKEFATHAIKTSRPFSNRLTIFVIGHVLLSYAITHYQMENIEFLRLKMLAQQEEDIKNYQEYNQINSQRQSKS